MSSAQGETFNYHNVRHIHKRRLANGAPLFCPKLCSHKRNLSTPPPNANGTIPPTAPDHLSVVAIS